MTPGLCPSDPRRDSVPGDAVVTSRSFLATHLRSILSFLVSFLVPRRSRPRWHFFSGSARVPDRGQILDPFGAQGSNSGCSLGAAVVPGTSGCSFGAVVLPATSGCWFGAAVAPGGSGAPGPGGRRTTYGPPSLSGPAAAMAAAGMLSAAAMVAAAAPMAWQQL